MTRLESRGFYVALGMVLMFLLMTRVYKVRVAVDRSTGRIVRFKEKEA